ncbi:iron complex transport system permease protein [Palleronia aestuarii]|uniref:Iron complex transport system permease protein n=1 Tax=Palleronia aestuarii TaxID=568105 RepID=A0A2W7N4X0_9RHOB|nr:iron chelate uptake ABC transporter family permease subunit [Palleronia aestuarii]PZX15121.1 iron complex transport system permease protein [Palleronia aestuarii]
MLDSVTAYLLLVAQAWDRTDAMRWLTGSVNGTHLSHFWPVAGAIGIFGGLLIATARGLGVDPDLTRLCVTVASVGLIAFATAAAGPIAFVAVLAGPISAQLTGGRTRLPAAATMGAILVLGGDYAGQFLLPARLSSGAVTGGLSAPNLLYLIVRANRAGGRP